MKIRTLFIIWVSTSLSIFTGPSAANQLGKALFEYDDAVQKLASYRKAYLTEDVLTEAFLDSFVNVLRTEFDSLKNAERSKFNTLEYRQNKDSFSDELTLPMLVLNAPLVIHHPTTITEENCSSFSESQLCVGIWGSDANGVSKHVRIGFKVEGEIGLINAVLIANDEEETRFSSIEWGEHLY